MTNDTEARLREIEAQDWPPPTILGSREVLWLLALVRDLQAQVKAADECIVSHEPLRELIVKQQTELRNLQLELKSQGSGQGSGLGSGQGSSRGSGLRSKEFKGATP